LPQEAAQCAARDRTDPNGKSRTTDLTAGRALSGVVSRILTGASIAAVRPWRGHWAVSRLPRRLQSRRLCPGSHQNSSPTSYDRKSVPKSRTDLLPAASRRQANDLLRQLAVLWRRPAVARLQVVVNPDLRRTLGRFSPRKGQIELSPAVLSPGVLTDVLVHEAAHAALALGHTKSGRPHGAEWRQFMALAGSAHARAARWCRRTEQNAASQSNATQRKPGTSFRYDHWCPVCQASRTARRPVRAWRCAACVAAGLPGRLEITRRPARLNAEP
jgi:predicted SprT family Zn-dependent metalloprotease